MALESTIVRSARITMWAAWAVVATLGALIVLDVAPARTSTGVAIFLGLGLAAAFVPRIVSMKDNFEQP